jgi:hypothetical protein
MVTGRQVMVELLRALCVLGLLFLNLAHVPAATAGDGGVLCGPAADAGHGPGDQEPCPACRLTEAGCVLPPVIGTALVRDAVAVGYDAPVVLPQQRGSVAHAWARGPPEA